MRKPFGQGLLQHVSSYAHLFCDFVQGLLQLQSDQLLPRIYTHQTSLCLLFTALCLTPPPLSSGSVDRTDDSIDYGTSVSEPGAEESDEGREQRQRGMDGVRGGEKESVHPRACQPFYYHNVCAFITMPANRKSLIANGSAATATLLNDEQARPLI